MRFRPPPPYEPALLRKGGGKVRLTEFDKDEWRDVARKLCPDWTDEDFEREWAAFQKFKRRKKMQ